MDDQVKRAEAGLRGHKIARRSVMVGAAWTVPAVVVGTSVPAWAGLSQEQPPVRLASVITCKFSNINVYHFELTFVSDQPILYVELSNLQLLVNPSSGAAITTPTAATQVIGPGQKYVLVVNSAPSTNAASFELYYHYDWRRSVNQSMSPVFDSGRYPKLPTEWSPQVGTFNNTPDCNAVTGVQYSSFRTPNAAQWFGPIP